MNFLLAVVPTLFVLGILIVIHEYGHFLACRMCSVKVEKFSIGFGPEIFRWQRNETCYVISLFPLGGFVKPAGESISEVGSSGPRPGDYLAAPIFSRIFIVVAGVAMNYILAFVLFSAVFMTGKPLPGTTIGSFMEGFPGAVSGLQKGDRVLEVNGEKVSDWMAMTQIFDQIPEEKFNLKVQRKTNKAVILRPPPALSPILSDRKSGGRADRPGGKAEESQNEILRPPGLRPERVGDSAQDDGNSVEYLEISVTPKSMEIKDIFGRATQAKRLGIMPDPHDYSIKKLGFFDAIEESLKTVVFLTVMTHKAIFYLIQGKLSMKTISGPLGIISMAGMAARMGVAHVLNLTANLSVSLAVINLFPIPALDGGHLLFLLIEGVRRRPVSLSVQEKVTQVGFALLLTLMGFIIYNDIVNFEYFERLKGLFVK